MPDAPTPWIGLAALAAMFAIPFLPSWLFDGPRTVRRYPRREICGNCHAPWTASHTCDIVREPLPHAELRRRRSQPQLPAGPPRKALPR